MDKIIKLVNDFKNVLGLITALAAVGGVFYGIQTYLDTAYASTDRVEKIEKRLSLQELKELHKEALDDLFFWRKKNRTYPDDQEIKEELDKSEKRVKELEKEIKEIEGVK